MKSLIPALFLLAFCLSAQALEKEEIPPSPMPWSVIGTWDCTYATIWADSIIIRADGTFSRSNGDSGRWFLTAADSHIALVLAWTNWPAGTMPMITPDEFQQKVGTGLFTLRRRGASDTGSIHTATWQQGQPPVRLIRKEDGFCALTTVTGRFEGRGEAVQVYVGADGYWYLGGQSRQRGVSAQCIVVPFRALPAPAQTVK